MSAESAESKRLVPVGRETGLVSPCISVCRIDEQSGWCKGCLRTKAEIKGWLRGSREEQLSILAVLKERRVSLGRVSQRSRRRRGGRRV